MTSLGFDPRLLPVGARLRVPDTDHPLYAGDFHTAVEEVVPCKSGDGKHFSWIIRLENVGRDDRVRFLLAYQHEGHWMIFVCIEVDLLAFATLWARYGLNHFYTGPREQVGDALATFHDWKLLGEAADTHRGYQISWEDGRPPTFAFGRRIVDLAQLFVF